MFKLHTILRQVPTTVASVVGSAQASPSHMKVTTYRCFLPNLTGFMGLHCLGPMHQHYLHKTASQTACLWMEFNLAKADCELQGTANSPSSTAMAEKVGFEPTIEFPLYTRSRRAPSTTQTSLHIVLYK